MVKEQAVDKGNGAEQHPGLVRRLLLLVLGVWLALCGGTLYAFSAFEVELKDGCHLSARELDSVYAAGQIGVGFFGMIVGALFDRCGPTVAVTYGVVLTLVANWGLAAALRMTDCGGLWFMALLYLLLQNGSVGLYQSGLFSNLRATPRTHQGVVAGIVAAGYGLSAALYSQIFYVTFDKSLERYFEGTAVIFGLTGVVAAVAIPFLRGGHASRSYGRLDDESDQVTESSSGDGSVKCAPAACGLGKPAAHDASPDKVEPAKAIAVPSAQGIISLREALRAPDLWMFVATFALMQAVGSGVFMANMSLMAESLGIPADERLRYVQMVSYFNCGGRIAAGFIMDALEPRGVPREANVVWCAAVLILVIAALLLTPDESLRHLLSPALVVIGFTYGAVWALMPAFVAGRFRGQHVGVCFNLHSGLMALTVLVTSYAVGGLYDDAAAAAAAEHPTQRKGSAGFCEGARCWRGPYAMGLGLACLGLLTGSVLTYCALRRARARHADGMAGVPSAAH